MIDEALALARQARFQEAAAIVRRLVEAGADLKGAHVNLAHIVFLAADWPLINALISEDRNNFVTSGWLDSVHQNRPVNRQGQPIPWLTYPAIEFLDDRVSPDWSVFEWGSGNSTLWWATRVKEVVAVEDDEGWVRELGGRIPANVLLRKLSGARYADVITDYPDGYFDAILIDGTDRNACAANSIAKIKPSGLVVFDNADSADYLESMRMFAAAGFMRLDFWGLVPCYLYKNCTSVFFRDAATLRPAKGPSQHHSSVGLSCFQAMESHGPT